MKRFIFPMNFKTVFPFLLVTVIFTLPYTPTISKYVWKDEIKLNLTILYPETELTSILITAPYMGCIFEGTGIQIVGNSGQWNLSAEEGYSLPETITVKIGENVYTVYTNGQGNQEGITFEQETGMLTVAEGLIGNDSVTITANGQIAEEFPTLPDVPPQITQPEDTVSGGGTGTESTDGATGTESEGESTSSESEGESAGSESSGESTGSESSGESTGSESEGESTSSENGGESTGTESSGESAGSEGEGESTSSENGGESTGTESGGESTGTESGGESTGTESEGESAGSESSGESAGTESGGESTGSESGEESTSSEGEGESTGSESSGESTSSESEGESTGSDGAGNSSEV